MLYPGRAGRIPDRDSHAVLKVEAVNAVGDEAGTAVTTLTFTDTSGAIPSPAINLRLDLTMFAMLNPRPCFVTTLRPSFSMAQQREDHINPPFRHLLTSPARRSLIFGTSAPAPSQASSQALNPCRHQPALHGRPPKHPQRRNPREAARSGAPAVSTSLQTGNIPILTSQRQFHCA